MGGKGDARVNGIWLAAITTLAFIGSVSESLAQQKMYWSHNDIGDHKMQRADLNGNVRLSENQPAARLFR